MAVSENHRHLPEELDPSLYTLSKDEADFFKQLTKIDDDEKLKEHIFAVQREAFEASTMSCTSTLMNARDPPILVISVSVHPRV
jgi:hypothetical protein